MLPSTDNPFVVIMLVVIIILAVAISLLASVLLSAAQYKAEEEKKDKGDMLAGIGAALAVPAVNGISDTAFYMIVSVIALEVLLSWRCCITCVLLLGCSGGNGPVLRFRLGFRLRRGPRGSPGGTG
jgi:hypothetical protein